MASRVIATLVLSLPKESKVCLPVTLSAPGKTGAATPYFLPYVTGKPPYPVNSTNVQRLRRAYQAQRAESRRRLIDGLIVGGCYYLVIGVALIGFGLASALIERIP